MEFTTKSGKIISFRSYQSSDETELRNYIALVTSETQHTLKYDGMPIDPIIKNLLTPDASFGAFHEGRLVGNLRFFQKGAHHPWIKHIGSFGMSVVNEYSGDGIGNAMLIHMCERAKALGVTRIEAEVRCSNTSAIALYLKQGFKIEGMREKAAIINGTAENEYFIAKILS